MTIDERATQSLGARQLLPPQYTGTWPVRPADVDLADKYRGALLVGAIGDALGRPAEGRPPSRIVHDVTQFVPWHGWQGGPKGTITDDTQMTMCVAQNIVAHGRVEPDDLARRFVDWLPVGRGIGRTCAAAVHNLMDGRPWWEAGIASAGNGAAMRVAPVGLRHPLDGNALRQDAALSALVTHADACAVVSAVAQAAAVAYCLYQRPGTLEPRAFLDAVVEACSGLHDPGSRERREDRDVGLVRLVDRIAEVAAFLHRPAEDAFAHFHNGAYVLESLPAAFWCFLASPDDPERVLVTAVRGGYDADTVAAMAGTLAGAHMGASALPARWLDDLEYRDELTSLADALLSLA